MLLGRDRSAAAGGSRQLLAKDWDDYVSQADALSQTASFQELRDVILGRVPAGPEAIAVDVGAGPGLLALPLALHAESVIAVDISPAMVECLASRARDAGLANVDALVGSATDLPIGSGSVDLVVSNYCLHHLTADEKRRALAEFHRILVPGGGLVFGDMMFEPSLLDRRGREIMVGKARALLRLGPAGALRLMRAGVRTLAGVGERPASSEWWRDAMLEAGFVAVSVDLLRHECGVAAGRKPS